MPIGGVEQMRLFYCIHSLGIGGAERQLCLLSRELAERGHRVHVAFLDKGEFGSEPNLLLLNSADIVLHRIRQKNNYDPLIILRLMSVIRRIMPDLMQTWLPLMDVAGGMAAITTGTPWILREAISGGGHEKTWQSMLRIGLAKRGAWIVSNSRAGDAYWRALGHTRRYVIVNGLPLEEIERTDPRIPAEFNLAPGERIVVYAGRLEAQKNLGNLIRAVKLARAQQPVVLIICGEGGQKADLARLVQHTAMGDTVRFVGFKADLWTYLKRADVFVSTSYCEGRPNTVLEAMACGCPLVVSDIPEHREFLDGRSALFADPHSPEQIAETILSVLSNPQAARQRALVAKARTTEWSVATMAGEYERVYGDIVSLSRHGIPSRVSRSSFRSRLMESIEALIADVRLRFGLNESGLVVLSFHHIFRDAAEICSDLVDPMQAITADHFRHILDVFLQHEYRFISPADLIENRLSAGRYALVTFDDGYADNARVLPLLKEQKIPAIFFVSTNHVAEGRCFWWDVIYRERIRQGWALKAIRQEQHRLSGMTHQVIKAYLRTAFGDECFEPRATVDRPFTADELATCARQDGILIGNHTHDHAILTIYPLDQARWQIMRCQEVLSEITGKSPVAIAYPDGRFSGEIIRTAREVGLKLGFSAHRVKNHLPLRLDDDSAMSLGRFLPSGLSRFDTQLEVFRANASVRHRANTVLRALGWR